MVNTSNKPGRRREQRRAIETKTALIDAAIHDFSRYGFDGAGTRSICKRAGVNSALITHHYGSKEALWKACAEHLVSGIEQRLREAGFFGVDPRPVIDPTNVLKTFIRVSVSYFAERPQFFEFMIEANRSGGKRLEWLTERNRHSRDDWVWLMTACQTCSQLRAGNAEDLLFLYIGAACSIFSLHRDYQNLTGESPFDEAVIERHTKLLIDLLVAP